MIFIEKFNRQLLEEIIPLCTRGQYKFNEHFFLDVSQLSNFFRNKILKSFEIADNVAFVALDGQKPLGLISCCKDSFDSEIFGFACYRISELMIFDCDYPVANQVISKLLMSLENILHSKSKPYYLTVSLNNNSPGMDYIFNALTQNHYYYIHTLLTFSVNCQMFKILDFSQTENVKIRKSIESDADSIADLAYKSFKYSRFHLDPNLDNKKACELLKTSAYNSVLYDFVDVMFIAEIEGKIVGYYSAKKNCINEFDKIYGEAVISAVDSDYRGLGIFKKLDAHLLNWFYEQTDFAEMGTYLINYPVHKTWINNGLGLVRGTHQFSKFVK